MIQSNIRTKFQEPFAALACAIALGCSGDPASIGDGPQDVDRSDLASYAADWDGYVEAYAFPSGSDRLRMTIDETGTGFLQLGGGDAFPLPTDAEIGWPPLPGLPYVNSPNGQLLERVRYPLENVRIESERISLQIDTLSAFAPFCELQIPVERLDAPGTYGCTATGGVSPVEGGCLVTLGGDQQIIECGKAVICAHSACACNATSCTGASGVDIPLDAALDDAGNELVGTLIVDTGGELGPRTVRLSRQ